MPSYFLTVRFPLSILGPDDEILFTDLTDNPSGYEKKPHVFYETDSESVAGELMRLFRRVEPPSARGLEPLAKWPPVFEAVSTAGLDLTQCVLLQDDLRHDLGPVEKIVALDEEDPAEWADKGLPHDLRTMVLVLFNKQARQWEPLVRDELGISPRPAVPADAGAARSRDETCGAKGTFAPWKDRIEKEIMEDIAHVANCEAKVHAAVAAKDLSGVLQAFAEDLRYWSNGVLKDVRALFMPDGELAMSLLRGTGGACGPIWLNRPFAGAYEAREMLEWHKSLEYAETFAQRVDCLLDARARLGEFLATHDSEASDESPPDDFLGYAEEMAKECRGIASSLADHVDLLARQAAEPGGEGGRDGSAGPGGATAAQEAQQAQEGSQASAESVPAASNRLRRGPNPEVRCDDKTCRYIREHPGRNDITLDEIASAVGYSRSMVGKTKAWDAYQKLRKEEAEQQRRTLREKQGMDDDFVADR